MRSPFLAVLFLFFCSSAHAEAFYARFFETLPEDPCQSLLAILDRPTAAYSACVIKPQELLAEYGYQYSVLTDNLGNSNFFPLLALRIGLPYSTELALYPPSYATQTPNNSDSYSGYSSTGFGLKHEFGYTENWIYTAQVIVAFPSGSSTFGSNGWGGTFNAIVGYSFTPSVASSIMLGVSSDTMPSAYGGERYNSFNPVFVLTWLVAKPLQLYAELYAQSSTGFDQGWGCNGDVGIQVLLNKRIEFDLSAGTRLSGALEALSYYWGVGGGVLF